MLPNRASAAVTVTHQTLKAGKELRARGKIMRIIDSAIRALVRHFAKNPAVANPIRATAVHRLMIADTTGSGPRYPGSRPVRDFRSTFNPPSAIGTFSHAIHRP